MKKFILMMLAACFAATVSAQSFGGSFPTNQVVPPYSVQVTYAKTVHILFPAAVRYVDLGSTDIIAGIVDGAENVLRVKAAVRGFEAETNFSVITSDGCFYSFNVTYADDPGQLNIEMEDWLRKNPQADFANQRQYVRLQELGEETPAIIDRLMYTIHKRNRRDIKNIGCKRFGVQALLKGLYIHNDLMFLHTALSNQTTVSFDVDYIRFKIVDKKVAKRTAVQEKFIYPVKVYNDMTRADGKATARTVFCFQKITIPDDKVLEVEIYEKDGGRHQSFTIENTDLVSARMVEELKLR